MDNTKANNTKIDNTFMDGTSVDNTVVGQLVRSMFRIRKAVISLHVGLDLNMGEIAVMKAIVDKAACNKRNMCVSDIQSNLHITKPAVSQIYSSLEKKGYIIREIDKSDRRKINVTLTAKGTEVLDSMMKQASEIMNEVISRLGDDDTKKMIQLFNRFADITDDLRQERSYTDSFRED